MRIERGLVQPVVVAAGVGLALGAVDLLVLAFAEQRGHGDDTVAWIFAALSAGSAVGGLLYGAVEWRAGARVRLPALTAGLGLSLAVAGLAPSLATLTGAVVCAGLFVAPALTTAYLVADESAAPGARVQAGAWVNTAVNAGISDGSGGRGTAGGPAARGHGVRPGRRGGAARGRRRRQWGPGGPAHCHRNRRVRCAGEQACERR